MASVADIISISAPASAVPGARVDVDVSVKNISGVERFIALTGIYDSDLLSWETDYLSVPAGQTVVIGGYFTMPSKNVRVTVYSFWWDGGQWVQDDTMTKDISVGGLEPEFQLFGVGDYSKT